MLMITTTGFDGKRLKSLVSLFLRALKRQGSQASRTDQWRYSRIPDFIKLGKPVHVGRINGVRLWQMDRIGVASVDGAG